jgi:hypothetical protein
MITSQRFDSERELPHHARVSDSTGECSIVRRTSSMRISPFAATRGQFNTPDTYYVSHRSMDRSYARIVAVTTAANAILELTRTFAARARKNFGVGLLTRRRLAVFIEGSDYSDNIMRLVFVPPEGQRIWDGTLSISRQTAGFSRDC